MGVGVEFAHALLEAAVFKTPLPESGELYLTLLHVPAVADDDGTTLAPKEVDYPGWARVELPPTAWGEAALYELRNVLAIALPPAPAETAPVVGFALVDAPTGGELRFRGECRPFVLTPDEPEPRIPAGALRLVLA